MKPSFKIALSTLALTALSLSAMAAPSALDSSQNMSTIKAPAQKTREDYAMKGFSVGATASFIVVDIRMSADYPIFGTLEDRSLSNEVRFAGLMTRYSVVPKKGLGFDGNITLQKSTNHKDFGNGEFTMIHGEGNVVGSFRAGNQASIYGLTGLNLEHLSGNHSEDVIEPFGIGGQLGVGVAASSSMNFELIYTASYHKLSNKFKDLVKESGGTLNDDKSFAIFKGAMARMNYSF